MTRATGVESDLLLLAQDITPETIRNVANRLGLSFDEAERRLHAKLRHDVAALASACR